MRRRVRQLTETWKVLSQAAAFKPWLRLAVIGVSLGFLGRTLFSHWSELSSFNLTQVNGNWLLASTGLTLLGFTCNGLAWRAILRALGAKVPAAWSVRVYLQTNLARYTPGDVWHFYARILAGESRGIARAVTLLSVVIESVQLLVLASVMGLGLLSGAGQRFHALQFLALAGIVVLAALSLKPDLLNRVLQWLSQWRKPAPESPEPLALHSSLLPAYLGSLAFLVIRALGLWAGFLAFTDPPLQTLPLIVGAFSCAWTIGFLVPGAPAGIGVFESVMLLLVGPSFSSGVLLAVLAMYRLTSTLAEVLGAALVSLPGLGRRV